ncbi:hypothetical protein ACHAQA_009431 [Verticillium albo-atrum]
MAVITHEVLIAAQRRLRQHGFHFPQTIILNDDARAIWVALKAHPLCSGGVDPNRSHLLALKDTVAENLTSVFGTCIDIINEGYENEYVAHFPEDGPLLFDIINALIDKGERWKSLTVCNQTDEAHERFRNFLATYLNGRKAYKKLGNVYIDNLSRAGRGLLTTIDELLRVLEKKKGIFREEPREYVALDPPEDRGSMAPIVANPEPFSNAGPSSKDNTYTSHTKASELTRPSATVTELAVIVAALQEQVDEMTQEIKEAKSELKQELGDSTHWLAGELERHAGNTTMLFHNHSLATQDNSEQTAHLQAMRQQNTDLQGRVNELTSQSVIDKQAVQTAVQEKKILAAEKDAMCVEKDIVTKELRWTFEEMLPAYNKERKAENAGLVDITKSDFDWFVGSLPGISNGGNGRHHAALRVGKESAASVEEVKKETEKKRGTADISEDCDDASDKAVQDILDLERIMAAFSV